MNDFGMKDSGARQEFDTGARRDLQDGKGRPDLIPTLFIHRLASVMEKGAAKYGDRNWEKGMPLSRYYASAQRHLMQAFDGDVDEDHLGQCAFNIAAFMWTLNEIQTGRMHYSLDDRPIPQLQGYEVNRHWVATDEGRQALLHFYEEDPWGAQKWVDENFGTPDTPTADEIAENLVQSKVDGDLEAKLTAEGLVKCYDGIWRPRTMPEGTPIQTPIYAQEAEQYLRDAAEDTHQKPQLKKTPAEMDAAHYDALETGEL